MEYYQEYGGTKNRKPDWWYWHLLMINILVYVLLGIILIYASIIDIKKRVVPNRVIALISITGLLHMDLSSVWGFIFTFVSMVIIGITVKGIGGGDVKLISACSFALKGINGLVITFVGLIIALMTVIPYYAIKKKSIKENGIPLVPFITIGYFILIIMRCYIETF